MWFGMRVEPLCPCGYVDCSVLSVSVFCLFKCLLTLTFFLYVEPLENVMLHLKGFYPLIKF